MRFNMVPLQAHILLNLLMNCNFLIYCYYKRLNILSQPQHLWSAEQESNPHSRGRSSMFYPLNYRQCSIGLLQLLHDLLAHVDDGQSLLHLNFYSTAL
jgi:hypothetical protein